MFLPFDHFICYFKPVIRPYKSSKKLFFVHTTGNTEQIGGKKQKQLYKPIYWPSPSKMRNKKEKKKRKKSASES